MYANFPLHLNDNGSIAGADYDRHIMQMIEQFLFTAPEERVNRPTFGGGVAQMVFDGMSPEIAATMQFHLQATIQQVFSHYINLQSLTVKSENNGQLILTLSYIVRQTGQRQNVTFTREAASWQ